MKRLIISLLALLLLLLSGCANQKYPTGWAKPETSLSPDGCTALAGTYSNKSNAGTPDSGIGFYLVHNYYSLKKADHFELIVPKPGTLKIVTYLNDSVVGKFHFSEQEKTLKCLPTGAELYLSGWWGGEDVIGISKKTVSLGKDTNGYLILENDESGVAFLMDILPMPNSGKSWIRFHPIVCERPHCSQ